jgi:hypothetical protein
MATCGQCNGTRTQPDGRWCRSCVGLLARLVQTSPHDMAVALRDQQKVRERNRQNRDRRAARRAEDRAARTLTPGGTTARASMPKCERCGREQPLTVKRGKAVCIGGCD